jgi:hypothetical protein
MGIELQTKYHHQQNRYFGPPDGYHFFFFSNLYVILSNIHLIFGGSPLVLLRRYGGIHVYGRLLVPFRLMYGFFVCVCVCVSMLISTITVNENTQCFKTNVGKHWRYYKYITF